MELIFSESAKKQLESLPRELKPMFLKHFTKILEKTSRRHLKHGIPYHVENITKQARIIYEIRQHEIYILQCFKNHKEYERWYKTYK